MNVDTSRNCLNCLHCCMPPDNLPVCVSNLNPTLNSGSIRQTSHMALFCDSYRWAPYMYPKFRRMVERGMKNHGDLFSLANIATKFVPYYEKPTTRIKVDVSYRSVDVFGLVGVTSGWRPSFLLLRSRKVAGSTHLLKHDTPILGVKRENARSYTLFDPPQ